MLKSRSRDGLNLHSYAAGEDAVADHKLAVNGERKSSPSEPRRRVTMRRVFTGVPLALGLLWLFGFVASPELKVRAVAYLGMGVGVGVAARNERNINHPFFHPGLADGSQYERDQHQAHAGTTIHGKSCVYGGVRAGGREVVLDLSGPNYNMDSLTTG